MDCHEAGRSISTLMSNELFHNDAYNFETKDELLSAINAFLDESIVLPPGNWDNSNLLNIQEIADIRRRKKERKEATQQIKKVESEKNMTKQEEAEKIPETEEKVYDPNDPMQRAPYCFGGMINDIKRRAPHYLSDFKVNNFVFATFFFCLYCGSFKGQLISKGNFGAFKSTIKPAKFCKVFCPSL